MKVRGLIGITALCLLACATPAGAQTVVLHADFNADTPGSRPSTDPSGDPDGDYLTVVDSGGAVLVESEYQGLVDQPVVLTRDPGGYIALQGYTDPDYRDCENYTVSWKQVVDRKPGFIYMNMFSNNSRGLASVEYRADGVLTANGSANVLGVTYAPWTTMEWEVHIDLIADKVDVMLDGAPVAGGQDLNTNQVGGVGLRGIAVAFGLLDPVVVAIDDLHVTAFNCGGVPVEEASWGTLKSVYR